MLFGALLMLAVLALPTAGAVRYSHPRTSKVVLGIALLAVAFAATDLPSGYTLRKTLGLLLMPVGLVWLTLLTGAGAAAIARRPRLAVGLVGLFLALGVAGSPILGSWLIHRLERPFEGLEPFAEGPFEAVLVLGGGAGRDQNGHLTLDDAADRVLLPVRLHRAGRTEWLVATGPVVVASDGTLWSYPELVAALWVELGVPSDRIVCLTGPTSTTDEAARFQELVARTGWTRIGVVTSAFHMRRGLANLRRNGIEAVPIPCDFRFAAGPRDLRALVPQASGFMLTQLALWEVLGSIAGR